jgi:hypothetical protein
MLGDFYPLFPHSYDQDVWYGYQFHRPDLDAGFAVLFRREACPERSTEVALRGLDRAASYEVIIHDTGETRVETGAALAAFRADIEYPPGSLIVFYRKAG